ncbi:hypothetical protein NKH73_13955 [Mesorhizobium sp. M0938]|uniref:hypothetical protein n=1 Tax=unclassified Mesorhizobium TaxID=325217 RepID=UPI003339AD70
MTNPETPPVGDAAEAVDKLRKALIAVGRNVGAFLANDVSTEFLLLVPEEVRLAMERAAHPLPKAPIEPGVEKVRGAIRGLERLKADFKMVGSNAVTIERAIHTLAALAASHAEGGQK